jgi:two-component system, sensor histidine kinase and response regulator
VTAEFFKSILNASPDEIAVIGEDGVISWINEAWIDFSAENGWPLETDFVGMNYLTVCEKSVRDGDASAEEIHSGIVEVMRGKRAAFDCEYPSHGSIEKNWFNLRVARLDWDGAPMFALHHSRITRRKLAEMASIEAREEAERASNAKSAFLSSMSHELRTPLNSILGFAQLVATDPKVPLDDDQTVSVNQILSNGSHLLNLLDDLLHLSSIESGQFQFSKEPVDLNAVCAECLAIVEPLAMDRGLSVTREFGGKAAIFADTKSIKQILINILSNAIKYNKKDGSVSLVTKVTHDNRVRVSVVDTGLGIRLEKFKQVFELFDRLGREQTSITGAGIGLNITKRLVEALGGVIDFTSDLGNGAVFWVEFPAA